MAIKFQTNIPQILFFPYGDFMEVNGQYGQQFMYTVEADSQRDKLYATPNLHDQLQAAGIGPGSALTITKVESEGNRKDWLIAPNDNGQHYPDSNANDPSQNAPANGSATSNRPEPPDFATLDQLMSLCLRSATTAWQGIEETVEVTSDDIRRTALSLFIECTRRGIRPTPPAEPVPTNSVRTPVPDDEEDLPF